MGPRGKKSAAQLSADAFNQQQSLEGERTGLVRPQLDANGRWKWIAIKPSRVVNGKLVLDEKVR